MGGQRRRGKLRRMCEVMGHSTASHRTATQAEGDTCRRIGAVGRQPCAVTEKISRQPRRRYLRPAAQQRAPPHLAGCLVELGGVRLLGRELVRVRGKPRARLRVGDR